MNQTLVIQKNQIQNRLNKLRPVYERALFHSLLRYFKDELLLLTLNWKTKEDKDSLIKTIEDRSYKLQSLIKSHFLIIAKDWYPGVDPDLIIKFQVARITKTTISYLEQAFLGKDFLIALSKVYNNNGRYLKIAKTEVNTMINFCLFSLAMVKGLTKKYWVCLSDLNSRDTHVSNCGKSLPLMDKWEGNLLFPGDPAGDPKMIINCRCFQIYE